MSVVVLIELYDSEHQCAVELLRRYLPKGIPVVPVHWTVEMLDKQLPSELGAVVNLTRETYFQGFFSWIFQKSDINKVINVHTRRPLLVDFGGYPKLNQVLSNHRNETAIQFTLDYIQQVQGPSFRIADGWLVMLYCNFFKTLPTKESIHAMSRLREITGGVEDFQVYGDLVCKSNMKDFVALGAFAMRSQEGLHKDCLQRTSSVSKDGLVFVNYNINQPIVHYLLSELYPDSIATVVHQYNHAADRTEYHIVSLHRRLNVSLIPLRLQTDYTGDEQAVKFHLHQFIGADTMASVL